MIKRIFLILIVIGCCLSCNSIDKPKKPDNLISKDKMVDILYDVFVFNAAKATDKRKLEDNNVTPSLYVYNKHEIDSIQFVNSNEYYAYNIKVYEEIITRVEAKIKSKKAKFQKEIDQEEERRKKRLDSIKNLGDTIQKKKPKLNFKSTKNTQD